MRDVAADGFPAVSGQSRLLLTPDPDPRAFFNQSRPDRRAGRMSVSMERSKGCLKASVEVPV